MNPKRIPIDPIPGTMQHELTAPLRQRLWRVCCQAIDEHRFDCGEVARDQRGAGPFGPVRGAS